MGGPRDLLRVAASQIGTVEKRSNRTKYGEAYGWNGVAWCQIFVWWCLKESGNGTGGFPKSAWTPDWQVHGKKQGRQTSLKNNTDGAKPGDVVHFYSSKTRRIAHVGIIERIDGKHHIITIEGNTSPSNRGSQRNGGQVARRRRYVGPGSSFVHSCTTPIWQDHKATPAAATAPKNWYKGLSGEPVKEFQKILGIKVDGVFGGDTEKAVVAFQKSHNLKPDGIVGPVTARALREVKERAAASKSGQARPIDKDVPPLPHTLKKGCDDCEEVKFVQRFLRIKVDGNFGDQTRSHVVAFQLGAPSLLADGIVGTQTWSVMHRA